MRQYELNGKIVGVVPITVHEPNSITIEEINGINTLSQMGVDGVPHFIDIPEGSWQIISLASEMTEEKAKLIMEKNILGLYANYVYKHIDFSFVNALDSFTSWLKSLGYVIDNPIPQPEAQFNEYGEGGYCETWIKDYEEAQGQVQKLLIIYKNK